jgi:hypothetical protein
LDRGIVSEPNLTTLRTRGAHYLVGTPRARLRSFERELLAGDWQHVREAVEVQLLPSRDGTETFVLCRSATRRQKEQAMRRLASQRLEVALDRLAGQVADGTLRDTDRLQQRIGRLKERYARVAALYEITVVGRGAARRVHWRLRPERLAWHEARAGAYLLRTNLTATDPAALWTRYVQLTEVEAAFRALKSELAIRPIWHQKATRVHILVAFLGYALWVTFKHTLRAAGTGLSPAQALHGVRGVKSGDILLETSDGRTLRFRRVSRPDRAQQRLLHALRVSLPERLGLDAECSGDSASPPLEDSTTYVASHPLRA